MNEDNTDQLAESASELLKKEDLEPKDVISSNWFDDRAPVQEVRRRISQRTRAPFYIA